MRAVAIALILAMSATSSHADDADPVAQAMQLEAQLQYEPALAIIERAIAQGGADQDRLVTLHLFAGRLAAGLEREAVAEDHFARVLALAPTTRFAAGTSPKITEPFDRARGRTAPLRITAEIKPDAITIVPEADPLGLVAGIAVKLEHGRELREMGKRRLKIPTGEHATEVFALDTFGNRVWASSVTMPIDLTTDVDPPLRPLYQRWPFWASATAIALTAGGICAWRMNVAQDEWDKLKLEAEAMGNHDFSKLEAVEKRGDRWALAANISFGAAAVTTLVAIITAARGSTTTAVVTAQPDSVGLAIAGGF